jgi:KDO2-lipid IV(A) lauroyltransferase
MDDTNTGWVNHSLNTGKVFTIAERICTVAPRPLLNRCVDLVMFWAACTLKGPRDAIRANLEVVKPGIGRRERNRLARRTFRNYGRCVADYLRFSNRPEVPMEYLFSRVAGLEQCLEILDRGNGLILAAAHLGNWELGGITFSRYGYPINALAISEDDPDVEKMRLSKRANRGVQTLYVGQDLGTLFRIRAALARNEVVALLADRCHGRDRIEVDFFGRATPMMRSPALVSRFTGSPIVPCAIMMDGEGRYESVTAEPLTPPEGKMGDDEVARQTMQALARVFEGWIREHPDQWFNFFPYWGNGDRE